MNDLIQISLASSIKKPMPSLYPNMKLSYLKEALSSVALKEVKATLLEESSPEEAFEVGTWIIDLD